MNFLYSLFILRMNLGNIWSNTPNSNNNQHNNNVNNNKKNNYNHKTHSTIFNNIFSSRAGKNKARRALKSPDKIISGFSNIINNSKDRKKYWGTPTWYLFHSIASRINKEYYKDNYKMIWLFIIEICAILPCPYCRHHATQYVSKISTEQINTKIKLIKVLFDFHNYANRNSGSEQYLEEKLKKYEKSNMTNIFNLFQSRFFKSYILTREFEDWNKMKIKTKFLKFVKETQHHYN